jgi:glycerophosphoryl diester phosphodiesterase
MIVIGHRGCAGLEPENTLRGFKKAIEIGVDAIELDVRLTKDKNIVVIHDETLDRTTNLHGKVCDYYYKDINIPLLAEVFDLVKTTNVKVHIELKEKDTVELVIDLIKKYDFAKRVKIISFWHNEILKVKKIHKDIKTGLLITHYPAFPKNLLFETNSDSLCIVYDKVDSNLVNEVHSLNKEITVWGKINTVEIIDRMIELNVDGIGSDYPNLVIERLKVFGKR